MQTSGIGLLPAVLAIVFSLCSGGLAKEKPKQDSGDTEALVGPSSPTGWYQPAEFDNAVKAAATLGQPLAILYQEPDSTCPKHNAQRSAWMRAPELTGFIRVSVDYRAVPELVTDLRMEAKDKAGKIIPILFLGTASGKLLGVIPYAAPPMQFQVAVADALKSFGPVLSPKTALELWKKLRLARTLWKAGKTDAAMVCYQTIKREERKNPKLPIFLEMHKDDEKINDKGVEELAEIKQLFEQEDKQREARAALTAFRRRYANFKPAEDAKKLQGTDAANSRNSVKDAVPSKENTSRSWSDVSGKHKIEAELVAVNDDAVQLKKTDGNIISVPMIKLAQQDRKYVELWQKKQSKETANSVTTGDDQ